jgi:hypothetical protein
VPTFKFIFCQHRAAERKRGPLVRAVRGAPRNWRSHRATKSYGARAGFVCLLVDCSAAAMLAVQDLSPELVRSKFGRCGLVTSLPGIGKAWRRPRLPLVTVGAFRHFVRCDVLVQALQDGLGRRRSAVRAIGASNDPSIEKKDQAAPSDQQHRHRDRFKDAVAFKVRFDRPDDAQDDDEDPPVPSYQVEQPKLWVHLRAVKKSCTRRGQVDDSTGLPRSPLDLEILR